MPYYIKPYYRPCPLPFREKNLELFYAVDMEINGDTLRLWTGLGDIDLPTNSTSDKIYTGAYDSFTDYSNYTYCDDYQTLVFEYPPHITDDHQLHEAGDMTYSEWFSLYNTTMAYAGIFPILGTGYPDFDNEITEGVTKSLDNLIFDVSANTSLHTEFMYYRVSGFGKTEHYIPFTVDTNVSMQTFIGAGNMIGISDVENSTEIKYPSLSLSLSGLPADILQNDLYDAVLNENYQGNPITLYMGSIDDNGKPSMMVAYKGNIDVMGIDNNGNSIDITVTVKNRLQTLLRNKNIRYTEQRQLADFPGDTSLQYVTDLQDLEIEWG
jgi:hypothetical protein